jgi:predicted regulator of Ras-like GTPase activity (Roadblock/LC7/MglB family)
VASLVLSAMVGMEVDGDGVSAAAARCGKAAREAASKISSGSASVVLVLVELFDIYVASEFTAFERID